MIDLVCVVCRTQSVRLLWSKAAEPVVLHSSGDPLAPPTELSKTVGERIEQEGRACVAAMQRVARFPPFLIQLLLEPIFRFSLLTNSSQ